MKTQIDWIPLSEGAVAEGDLHLPPGPRSAGRIQQIHCFSSCFER
jgi:hypothetical protein